MNTQTVLSHYEVQIWGSPIASFKDYFQSKDFANACGGAVQRITKQIQRPAQWYVVQS